MSVRFLTKRKKRSTRFVPRPIPGVWANVQRVADARHARMAKLYLDAVQRARRQLALNNVQRVLEITNPQNVIDVLNPFLISSALEPAAIALMREIMASAARAALPTLPGFQKQEEGPKLLIGGFFDLDNPEAIRAAALLGADMVTNVTANMKRSLRQVILEAQERGIPIPDQARRIARELQRDVGLTVPQIKSLRRLQDTWEQAGFSDQRINAMLVEARDRMIRQRALVIARNETLKAANTGIDRMWSQAVTRGLLSANAKREWVTQPSLNADNPCPICRPMDGQVRSLGEDFVSPFDGSTSKHPPQHVMCVCVLVLVEDSIEPTPEEIARGSLLVPTVA